MRRRTIFGAWLVAASVHALPAASADEPGVEQLVELDPFEVADVHAAPSMARIGDRIVFAGRDVSHGIEPWITDGTRAGTRRIVDLQPGVASSRPRFFGSIGGLAVCTAQPAGDVSDDLWTLDPDDGTTTRLTRFDPRAPAVVVSFASFGARAVFAVRSTPGDGFDGLWTTDGTPEGTRRIAGAPTPDALHDLGDRAVYLGDDGVHGTDPWVTDGTDEGTTLVIDLPVSRPEAPTPHPFGFSTLIGAAGNSLFFAATGGIWATDGRATRMVSPARLAGRPGRAPHVEATPVGDTLFIADSARRLVAMTGDAPWGFHALHFPAARHFPHPFAESSQRVFGWLQAPRGDAAYVWTSDPSSPRPRPVRTRDGRRLPAPPIGQAIALGDSGAIAFIGPWSPGVGAEPWISDGSRAGTHLLADVAPGEESSNVGLWTFVGGRVLCVTDDPTKDVRRLVAIEAPR